MERLLTIELNQDHDIIELHLNKAGAEYLIDAIKKLVSLDEVEHLHLMTPYWGGNELSDSKQNSNDDFEVINQLKIMYWKQKL